MIGDLDDAAILAARGPRHALDPTRPFAVHVENERTASGSVEPVGTIFLTNRECPYRCLMCDLWKYTLTETLKAGQILAQLDHAAAQLEGVRHVKLYNAGNFFDARAVPRGDYPGILERLRRFDTVIVENHPNLCSDRVRRFAEELKGTLEVAMGLETVHPGVLPRLNKRMTLADFEEATGRLVEWGISVRAFVLLSPPLMPVGEAVEWARQSVSFAFRAGASVCTIIPTRAGNGIMERLEGEGRFTPPSLMMLEEAHRQALLLPEASGKRVFVDLWDVESLATCPACRERRIARMRTANLDQSWSSIPPCDACHED